MKTKPPRSTQSQTPAEKMPVPRVTRSSVRTNSLTSSEGQPFAASRRPATATRLTKRTGTARNPVTPSPTDEELLNQFGCKDMRIVVNRCDAPTSNFHHDTDEATMCAQFGVKQPGVALQRIAVPSPPEMNVDTLRMPVIRLQRIDSSTERRSSQPTAVAPSPTTQGSPASAQAAQHVPVYKIAQKAISPTSSNANAGASPDAAASANVFDFMSMSQDDIADDDPMREVIEKLHNENRIELKRNKRARQPGMGLAAKSKPVMKQPRKTKAPTVRQPPTAPLPPVVPSRVICSPPSHHEAGSVAAAPGQPNSIMPPPAPKVRPAVAVPLARNGAVRRNGPPHVLTKLMHQPTHQSTPIRPVQTAGAAAAADQAAAATGGPSNNNSSPWRVMDEQVPRTFYFSASTGDQLPSFSGDSIVVSINVPASQSNTTAPTNKRPADDALATGMETQKRPKVASVAADAVAAEQQLQKRLNFSEVTGSLNDSNSENIEPEHHAVQLAANKAKATRIVLGERCAVRSPLRPLAIRNVMLSPHTNSAHSSSSTDESVVFGSPTPINRLRLLSAQQRTPPPRHPPLQQPTADKTPPMQMIGQSSSNNATAIGSVSANASNASTPHANEAPDADLIDENTRTPAKATPPPVDGHRKNLSECFGFDSESEIEEAADDEPIRGQMVVNPFALRYKLKDLQKLRSTRRDSGPRRMLPPAAALPKPSAIVDVQLFKDVPAAPKQTIAKLWRQQRQPSAAVDGHSAATTSLQSVRVESTSDATGARKSSMAPESFNNFARGLERPNAPADTVEPVLFETRWPEQNNPNRKSYSRPFRKRNQNAECETSISDDDDDDDDEDDEVDNDLSAGERAKIRRAERRAKRKELEEAETERELQRFADEFNSMCEEVDQFDVIMERSA